MKRMSATEASRNFSALLNRVNAGEEIEITRSGEPVAVIGPPDAWLVAGERLLDLLANAPSPDEEFADEVRQLRTTAGPPGGPWPSSSTLTS